MRVDLTQSYQFLHTKQALDIKIDAVNLMSSQNSSNTAKLELAKGPENHRAGLKPYVPPVYETSQSATGVASDF